MKSISSLLKTASKHEKPLYLVIAESDCEENGGEISALKAQFKALWNVMRKTSENYSSSDRSKSGLSGGDAGKISSFKESLLGGNYILRVTEEALKTAECNACMKRIVAAPTAGSCGVLPSVLIPLAQEKNISDDIITEGLLIAAGFGEVAADRASISGAEGGCQAEIGTASAMAAAALVHIMDGSDEMCAEAFAIALSNLLGLVCDPVAGLVEIPCIKRNVIGAMNAVSSANMALAGIKNIIPADEVIDAMGEIGSSITEALRETGNGGLAATPTAKKLTQSLRTNNFE